MTVTTSSSTVQVSVGSALGSRRSYLLLALGLASAAIYAAAFTFTWPLWRLYTQPQADYAWFGRYTESSQVQYLGAFAALFVLQYLAYRLVRAHPEATSLDLIVAGQLIFGVLNVWIYPVAALDLYDYLMYGRIVLVYGGNPFFQPPSAFPDALVAYSPWPNERSVYGPVWQLLSLLPTTLAGDSVLRGLVAFKLLGLLAFVGCALVIWRLLLRLDPALAPAGTLLFAWNPLLQFELVGNGHNDVVMVLFALLAVWALLADRRLLVLPLLALAVLTKLLVVTLGPIFLYGLLRGRRPLREKLIVIVGGGAIGLALAAITYAPFWGGLDTFYFLSRGNWFTASFPTMLRELLRQWYPFEEAGRLSATLVGVGFALFTALRLAMLWLEEQRDATDEADWLPWLRAAHDLTFVYLAFATLWWQPWYLVWLVALAALLPSRLVHERALLFCYGATFNYLVFKYIWPVFQPMTYTTIMGISVIMIFGPVFVHLVWTSLVPKRPHPPASYRSAAWPPGPATPLVRSARSDG
jgi:hypothetical protein